MNNTKVVSDTETINNALESYSQENATLPMPWGNTNFFKKDTSYAHSYTWTTTFWVYGSLTEETLAKKYLDVLPLDPRTNSYYSYGKTKVSNEFEIASVQIINWQATAKVTWNYTAETWPYNLIREYNGSNFVYNGSITNLPYNTEELVLTATDKYDNIYREWDTINITSLWEVTKNTDSTIIATDTNWLELFFSDGSVSIITMGSNITLEKLSFPKEDNLNTLVKLSLWAGTIWTKATHLNSGSDFEVYTTDSTAAVRWTIFWVSTDWSTTDTIVVQWIVEVTKITDSSPIETLTDGQSIKTDNSAKNWTPTITEMHPLFSINTEVRDDDTVAMINQEEITWTSTCTPSKTDILWFITDITCDSNNIEVINYSCNNPLTRQLNTTKTACEDKPVLECTNGLREWDFTSPTEIAGTNAYFKNKCIKNASWNLVLWENIFIACLNNYSIDENTWNSCVLTIGSEEDSEKRWSKNWNWRSYDFWKLLQCFDTTNFVLNSETNTCDPKPCTVSGISWSMTNNKCTAEFKPYELIPNQLNSKSFTNSVTVQIWDNKYENVTKIANIWTIDWIVKYIKLYWTSLNTIDMSSVSSIQIVE